MAKCHRCGKGSISGNNVSHSKRHTKTRFYANIQTVNLVLEGRRQAVRMCTRCLRTMDKPERR